ncbi:MAG: choice-of-anchor D domain-containing protein [Acidobacteria bacterium]|nr:choice-of-anchor D domain-containing protein [Acidobacteriota bacterium]
MKPNHLFAGVAILFLTQAIHAQAPPFSMRVQILNRVETPASGGTIAMPAEGIGIPLNASLTLTSTNTATNTVVTLNGVTFSGSADFTATPTANWPLSLTVASPAAGVGLQYTPSISRSQTARVVFDYTVTVNLPAGPTSTTGTLTLNLSGTAPEFVYTYTPLPGGNSTLLNNGDTIRFPATELFDTTTTLIVLANRGSGQGVVNSITYTGAPEFSLAGLPFPPALVEAGGQLRFQVQFYPENLPVVTGSVRVEMGGNRTLNFSVTGRGLGAEYTYEVIQKGTTAPLPAGGLLTMADAAVNEKSQAVIRVRNVGNYEGEISAIRVTGTSFTLSETPFTPAAILAGAALTFTVNFSPTKPGKELGKLRIGDDSFDLEATGLGTALTYSYSSAGTTFQLQSGNSVVFAPVAVGRSSTVRVSINNTGTAAAAVNSISATGPTSTTFTLSGVPATPANIDAGASIGFNVTFAPTTLGAISGTVRMDNQTFTLTGIGTAPNALPSYTFQGSSGNVDPLQQPAVGLTLAADYPLDLNGTLTLAFSSDVFSNDPSVQFATGGRSVPFTIPANTRQAVFANRATQMRLQSGTVAGTIVLTPGFVTSGGIDVTPANPAALTLTMPQQAPVLLSVVLASKTSTTITLQISGYATSRSITQMDFQFTPTAGETLSTTRVAINAESSFNAWYQSTASQAFGSNFTVTVPFTLQGDINKVSTVADTVQSIAVTLTNRIGNSASRTINLR